jgi:hypothetical protein
MAAVAWRWARPEARELPTEVVSGWFLGPLDALLSDEWMAEHNVP